jgi:UDP-glucose 4-epimerase
MSWAGKRVLVTGADGFIGSHLTERLVTEGAQVRALCLYNSQGKLGWLDHIPADIREQIDAQLGDIRDARFVEALCEEIGVVFHLAALIAIPYSYIAPQSFVETNVGGTLNILEAARKKSVARLVQTSTSEVYGTPAALPIKETHPLQAQSPYAATKIAADQLALAYHRSFGVPVVVLRPFNTYGPRQSTRAVTATILSQLLDGRSEIQLGRLDTRRDLTYVADVVEGFLAAADVAAIEGETIQLGTGKSYSVREIFDAASRVLQVSARIAYDVRRVRPDASEVLALESDPSLAAERLGWRAKFGLDEGLKLTAEWMQVNLHHYRPEFLYA